MKKPGPTPSHPSAPMNAEAQNFAKRYGDYTSDTLAPRSGQPRPSASGTPRTYRVATRSARAGRGVSAGGDVQTSITLPPLRAFWLANKQDDRFGRLFVEFSADGGKPGAFGASRVLFADSFYAASSAVWAKHDTEASFREGEILILMSMDPRSQVGDSLRNTTRALLLSGLTSAERSKLASMQEERAALHAKARSGDGKALYSYLKLDTEIDKALGSAIDRLDPGSKTKLEAAMRELRSLRGIVIHPAIVGRELAWSAPRIDFWFNRLDALSREAAAMNGGRPIPDTLTKFSIGRASTWQFFEFDSTISLGQAKGRVMPLIVRSRTTDGHGPAAPAAATRSHFGVSLFGQKPGPKAIKAEDDLYRQEDLEAQVQPMLDWLATNHHDFMRLNDFSEAFSLLRWLNSRGIQLVVVDMDGQGSAIATPDRVQIDSGPAVAKP